MNEPCPKYYKTLSNWLTNNFKGICRKHKIEVYESGISPEDFGALIYLFCVGIINRKQLEKILEDKIKENYEGNTTAN